MPRRARIYAQRGAKVRRLAGARAIDHNMLAEAPVHAVRALRITPLIPKHETQATKHENGKHPRLAG